MNLILLGPPGVGKGTQAKALVADHRVPHVSTGDMLRAAVKAGSTLGREAKGHMDRGELVPDAVVLGLVDERLQAEDARGGFLLDGFPRTVAQAEALARLVQRQGRAVDHVLCLLADSEELVRRLSGRRTCSQCSAPYHVDFQPPRRPGVCDACGGALYQRDDDREAAIRTRLATYESQTRPLVDYYETHGLLRRIDGLGSVAAVTARVRAALR